MIKEKSLLLASPDHLQLQKHSLGDKVYIDKVTTKKGTISGMFSLETGDLELARPPGAIYLVRVSCSGASFFLNFWFRSDGVSIRVGKYTLRKVPDSKPNKSDLPSLTISNIVYRVGNKVKVKAGPFPVSLAHKISFGLCEGKITCIHELFPDHHRYGTRPTSKGKARYQVCIDLGVPQDQKNGWGCNKTWGTWFTEQREPCSTYDILTPSPNTNTKEPTGSLFCPTCGHPLQYPKHANHITDRMFNHKLWCPRCKSVDIPESACHLPPTGENLRWAQNKYPLPKARNKREKSPVDTFFENHI